MKTLYLLRHAHAEPAMTHEMDDHERALSARGQVEAANLGAFMKEQGFVPEAMFCSSSVRTTETAQLAFDVMFKAGKNPVATRFGRDFYLAPPDIILDEVRDAEDRISHLLVVGHNPGLEDLAEKLAAAGGEAIGKFPPCSLAVFTCDVDKWRDFSPKRTKLKIVFMP